MTKVVIVDPSPRVVGLRPVSRGTHLNVSREVAESLVESGAAVYPAAKREPAASEAADEKPAPKKKHKKTSAPKRGTDTTAEVD